jgi:hypothetical protein
MKQNFIRIEQEQYIKLKELAKKNKRSIQQQLAYLLEKVL